MIRKLGYPKGYLWVEREIFSLPHLKGTSLPNTFRRADILCFAKEIHPEYDLFPLLLIECKAGHWNQKAKEQVLGYNESVGAYFVAVAGCAQTQTLWFNSKKQCYDSVDFLPSYEELNDSVKKWLKKEYGNF